MNGEVSEDEKHESGSASVSISSATVKSSSKRVRARSGSSELGAQATRTCSSVTAASQNGSSKGWRSNATAGKIHENYGDRIRPKEMTNCSMLRNASSNSAKLLSTLPLRNNDRQRTLTSLGRN
ncbi:hypothetical protein RvY_05938 [Ramazzottius varieornatus]|uniref:Uncharacterized protein n=1 Tax=Ramazzottius varieornatus TaxID=947166 RepID=A0A1D1V3B8_RAMVA|nr:hypothetical protein RvY_05938 [Ramazzottius varieornatus]